MNPRVSVVIPVYNEGPPVADVLRRITASIPFEHELLVVYDTDSDSTIPTLEQLSLQIPSVRPLKNHLGLGPATAIRSGVEVAKAPVVIITMADGCDDPDQVPVLVKLVERGVSIACASRYTRGGQHVGGPLLKSLISRLAGVSLFYLARVGTRDATNSYKAYSREFIRQVGIESEHGFEIGLELISKARRHRLQVAEVPTIWLDRTFGESNFKIVQWMPHYLRWYFNSFAPRTKRLRKVD